MLETRLGAGLHKAQFSHVGPMGPKPDPAAGGLEIWQWSSSSVNYHHSHAATFPDQCRELDGMAMASRLGAEHPCHK